MNISFNHLLNKFLIFVSLVYTNSIYSSDSYEFNLYNNYGIVGTIHTPSARTFEEGVHGITAYAGTPNQTVTVSANPFDWLVFSQVLLPIISNFATSAAAIAALGNNN